MLPKIQRLYRTGTVLDERNANAYDFQISKIVHHGEFNIKSKDESLQIKEKRQYNYSPSIFSDLKAALISKLKSKHNLNLADNIKTKNST